MWLYSGVRSDDPLIAPLGEILRRARLAQGLSIEAVGDATRISRRYLEALEQEQFWILPAPVYARGFLRVYASYLGLDPSQLLPLFPVSYLDQPALEPLPRLQRPPVWSPSWLVGGGIVGLLVLIIVLLYTVARDDQGSPFGPTSLAPTGQTAAISTAASAPSPLTTAGILPDWRDMSASQAIQMLQQMGLSYFVLEVFSEQAPPGQVMQQSPAVGTKLEGGQVVTLVVSRGRR